MQSLNRNAAQADGATYAKIRKKCGLNEAQLRTIIDGGAETVAIPRGNQKVRMNVFSGAKLNLASKV
jgi:hypothetical protein